MSLFDVIDHLSEHDPRLTLHSTGILAEFNRAGVISAADVHIARTMARATREQDEQVVLAAALASRAVRSGSVALDTEHVLTAGVAELPDLPWPHPEGYHDLVAASKLVSGGALVVDQGLIYLQRYHHQEVQVVQDLQARAALPDLPVDESVLATGLERIFPGPGYAEQRAAAEVAVRARTSIITGGPGTGKTTTVAGVLALLAEQTGSDPDETPLRVGLAAPTGKAAARVKAAVSLALAQILHRTPDPAMRAVIEPLADLEPMTVHRLLGWRPGSRTRFRHHRTNRLPYDVVLVDEASMVSLTHMARLLEALRPTARLILVGDADQLVSVDAGAVLADLVAAAHQPSPPVAVSSLRTVHRFGTTIGALAQALRDGDADGVFTALTQDSQEVEWIDAEEPTAYLRPLLVPHARAIVEAARTGDGAAALEAMGAHRLLCAHREGPFGVRTWNRWTESWLAEETGWNLYDPMYVGRPLIVTANDYATGVLNGDIGVVIPSQKPDGTAVKMVQIEGATGQHRLAPGRLSDIDTLHAMTIHKAQGSQASEITVLLPELDSPLLTRELFYTAVTRAERTVRIVGSEEVIRAAVEQRVVRASGLTRRLLSAEPATLARGSDELPPL